MKTKPEPGAELLDVDIPTPGPDEVLVKVLATSICGTDLHIYQWNDWAKKRIKNLPQIMGHELCGQVIELGTNVCHIKKDSIISAETHIACGYCHLCKIGMMHICENVKIFGVDRDGVFAEYSVVPARNAWAIEEKIPKDYISIMEPLGNAVHTVLAGEIAGSTVLITGCGPIGLMAIGLCKICGATNIIATEVNEYRIQLAKKMGADLVINPKKDDAVSVILKHTNGQGVDVVLEMSGNPSAIGEAFEVLRPGGRYSILGIPEKTIKLDLADIVFKYFTIQGINGRLMFSTWVKSSRFLASGRLELEPLITHRFRLEEFKEAMELMETGNCGKIILYP